jgi:hypothetical protein
MSEHFETLLRVQNAKMHNVIEVDGFTIPEIMSDNLERIKTLETRPDDVFIVTFPKSGTTWIQEMVYVIRHDCNFDKAYAEVLDTRVPFLEFPLPGIDFINKMESPRSFKTHYPLSLLPENIENKSKVFSLSTFSYFISNFLNLYFVSR